MFAYLEIMRPSVCALGAFAVLVGALISGFPLSLPVLTAMVVSFLVAGAGNTLNDYFDYESDKVNKPHRIIPSGRISRDKALKYSFFLYFISLLLFFFLNIYMLILAVFNVIVTLLYSWRLKKFPLIGNFGPSWLAASAFLFGGILTLTVSPVVIILAVMSFSANVGREIVKSIEDVKGDAKHNVRTISVALGEKSSDWIAVTFIGFAIMMSFLPYIFGYLNFYYLIVVMISDALFVYSCYVLFKSAKKAQKYMKIAMGVGILSFLVGII